MDTKTSEQHGALDLVLALSIALNDDMDADLAKRGLTRSRTHLLWLVHRGGPSTQRALASQMSVSARNVTGLVDALAETGFVTREPHPSDRRATLVTLTRTGSTAMRRMEKENAELAEQLFGQMPAAELRALVGSLSAVLERVEALTADAG